MCGIFAVTPYTERLRQAIPTFAIAIENRGKDSWGATDGTQIHKCLGKITDNFEYFSDWERLLLHTRQATTGEKTVENSHPFECFGTNPNTLAVKKIIGVHNGVVTNDSELNQKYSRNCSVDSEHIFQHLAEGRSLEDVEAHGPIVWIEDDSELLNFAILRRGDLHIAKLLGGEFVLCSYEYPIDTSARMFRWGVPTFFKIESNHRYYIKEGSCYKGAEIEVGESETQYAGWLSLRSHSTTWERCYSCNTKYVEGKKLVCSDCFLGLTTIEDDAILPESVFVRSNGPSAQVRL